MAAMLVLMGILIGTLTEALQDADNRGPGLFLNPLLGSFSGRLSTKDADHIFEDRLCPLFQGIGDFLQPIHHQIPLFLPQLRFR